MAVLRPECSKRKVVIMANFVFENKSIYYEEYGQGAPILVLNGIMMSCMSWKEFVDPLKENNRLILMDFLDQGKSQRMTEPFSQSLQVEVVHALLNHLKIDRINLVGISYGGEIALQFAVKYPERLERLALFNTTAKTGPWLKDIGDAWNLAANDADAYYLTTIPVIYSPGFYLKNNDWLNRRRELLRSVFSNPDFTSAMERLVNSAAEYDVSEQIHNISAPTLVVSCEQDYLTPMEEQRIIASLIPDCQRVILPNCGHASMYEQPVLFTSLILGFFNNSKMRYGIV